MTSKDTDKKSSLNIGSDLSKKINFEITEPTPKLPLYMKLAGRKQASKAFKPKYEFKATEESIIVPEDNSAMKEMLTKLE